MKETPFYGRQEELERLRKLLKKPTSSLVVIKGRRRIGKSRLIEEFGTDFKTFVFTGLPPEKNTNAQEQRDDFARHIKRLFGGQVPDADDWGDIFWHLAKKIEKGRIILVFDEINWIGSFDNTFLGKLKSAWDLYFKKNPKLIFILSGSMSTWIDKNILSSTGFMGRISLELTLDELPLPICNLFWRRRAHLVSAYEKFKILSVTGGVPRYLEEIDPSESAEENINTLAFTKGGLLVEEFDRIFSDLFLNRSERYQQIAECLVEGNATLEEIREAIRFEKGGTLSNYLEDLIETGYVACDYSWNIEKNAASNLRKYRLKDNYLRFYLKYIKPHKNLIEKGLFKNPPAWTTIMGLAFENLVINNFHQLYTLLRIDPAEIVFANPYFQRTTLHERGCQIDYLLQTKFNTLYLCEIKFSKKPLGLSVIREVKEKIERLVRPKALTVRPVLVHVNGVDDSVVEREFFTNIIDFGQMLTEK